MEEGESTRFNQSTFPASWPQSVDQEVVSDPSLATSFPRNFRLGLREVGSSLDGTYVWLLLVDIFFCDGPYLLMEMSDADTQ